MPPIRFIQSDLPDPSRSHKAIVSRFTQNALLRDARRAELAVPTLKDGTFDLRRFMKLYPDTRLSYDRSQTLHRRADKIATWHEQSSPLFRLKDTDRDVLMRLRDGAEVTAPPVEDEVYRISSNLTAEFPWMGEANTLVMRDMLLMQKRGEVGFHCKPIVLNGPPGNGKSTWARRFAEIIGVPSTAIDATGESAGFSIGGVQKGWSSGAPGRPLNLILTKMIANPIVIVDEIEKAGRAPSSHDAVPSIVDALLPFLEPLSASRWNCPFYQLVFNMSYVTWIFTSNSTASLPEPLLSRCRVVDVGQIGFEDLQKYAKHQSQFRGLSRPSTDAILAAVTRLQKGGRPVNLRRINNMLDLAETLQSRPILH